MKVSHAQVMPLIQINASACTEIQIIELWNSLGWKGTFEDHLVQLT